MTCPTLLLLTKKTTKKEKTIKTYLNDFVKLLILATEFIHATLTDEKARKAVGLSEGTDEVTKTLATFNLMALQQLGPALAELSPQNAAKWKTTNDMLNAMPDKNRFHIIAASGFLIAIDVYASIASNIQNEIKSPSGIPAIFEVKNLEPYGDWPRYIAAQTLFVRTAIELCKRELTKKFFSKEDAFVDKQGGNQKLKEADDSLAFVDSIFRYSPVFESLSKTEHYQEFAKTLSEKLGLADCWWVTKAKPSPIKHISFSVN